MAPAEDTPSLRQRLHSATGDRHKEAEALAERSPDEVGTGDAEVAVRRAHGDIDPAASERRPPSVEPELASPGEAEQAHEEHPDQR